MAQKEALREQIIARYADMSPQLRQAARHVLEHPERVALVSMRELARRAGVQPATMTRLAKFLDLAGYDQLRASHAEAVMQGEDGFASRVRQHDDDNAAGESGAPAHRLLEGLADQITRLREPESLGRIEAMAARLIAARRIYVLGLRSCHVVAWHFHYVMSLLGERSVHLDGPGGTGSDALSRATQDDVVLAVSIQPYAADTLELARLARDRGLAVVAITDSEVSPLVALSEQTVLCATQTNSFFHTLAPALAISEVLCMLLAESDRPSTLSALQRVDEQLASLDTFVTFNTRRAIRTAPEDPDTAPPEC